jgi:hypothetical protein
MASAMPAGDGGLSGLPSPPPAIRPPESALVQAEAPAPEPLRAEPAPEAPVEPAAPVIDYFATDAPAAEEAAPVVELPSPAPVAPAEPEPAQEVELQPIPLMAPAEPEPAAEAKPVTQPAHAAPGVELPAMAPEPDPAVASAPEELFAPKRGIGFRVLVRLKESDGVEVGSFGDFGTAIEAAQEVVEQASTATEGKWPFYAGRFVRPDLIVSVDVVEGGDEL